MNFVARAATALLVACAGFSALTPRAFADEPLSTHEASPEAERKALILPALIDDGTKRRPSATETEWVALVAKLDDLLADTARDLGLAVESRNAAALGEPEMIALAQQTGRLVLAAWVHIDGAEVELRLTAAAPGRRTVVAKSERFARDDVSVRTVVMLRDVVKDSATSAEKPKSTHVAAPPSLDPAQLAVTARSEGRTVLAVNATVFGGLMGFSVERASGSNDPRLLYPLVAVGAGIGLGASLLVANEWDVGTGDAWFLSSGGVWPTAAAHLIYEGRFGGASGHAGPEGDRWAFGVVGGAAGLTLSTLSLAMGDMSNGGAVLAHSGGALGFAFGGLTELFVRGDTGIVPFAGMGYGAAIGWLAAAGAATTRYPFAPVRILALDLGAVLGGLAGAALASPLVFDHPTSDQTRGWIGAIGGGALLGAGAALWITREPAAEAKKKSAGYKLAPGTHIFPELPEVGMIGQSALAPPSLGGSQNGACTRSLAQPTTCALEAIPAPVFGARIRGSW
ncbi:MAG: hypothetical protein IPK82_26250 [Polyangiaceae bacterium]|nr:hypothetical protein [Polyangiaceae bacterium]